MNDELRDHLIQIGENWYRVSRVEDPDPRMATIAWNVEKILVKGVPVREECVYTVHVGRWTCCDCKDFEVHRNEPNYACKHIRAIAKAGLLKL